jgi:hypothetical protein
MSLMKIPFTLAALAGIHTTFTPPNPASEGEGKRVAEGQIRLTHLVPIVRVTYQCRLLHKHLLNPHFSSCFGRLELWKFSP